MVRTLGRGRGAVTVAGMWRGGAAASTRPVSGPTGRVSGRPGFAWRATTIRYVMRNATATALPRYSAVAQAEPLSVPEAMPCTVAPPHATNVR